MVKVLELSIKSSGFLMIMANSYVHFDRRGPEVIASTALFVTL